MKKRTNKREYKKTLNSIITCSLIPLFTCSFLLPSLPAFAYEDCVIMTNGKLSDIRIQNNDIVDVYPVVTISNNKNILIVHPLKSGKTKFSVLKNNKEKSIFTININEIKTDIENVEGYEIFNIDSPPDSEYDFEIDKPPMFVESGNINNVINAVDETINTIMINPNLLNRINESMQYHNMIDNLDEPPKLRGERSEIAD